MLDQMTSCILNNCGSWHHCGWACAFSDFQQGQMTCCIGHNYTPFPWCGLPFASSELLLGQMTSYIANKCSSSRLLLPALVDVDLGHSAVSTVAFLKLRNLNIFFDKTETYIWLITYCHFYFLNIGLEKCWTFFWEWSDASTILENGTNKKDKQVRDIFMFKYLALKQLYSWKWG